MKRSTTRRYCVDRRHIKALQNEGIGWGYDLNSGCFQMEALPNRATVFANAIRGIFK